MTNKKISYPIGIQNFPEIFREKKFYVDKTDLVFKLCSTFKYVFLIRPRRFGKSLLLSTIKAYFEGRRELFQGLAISDMEDRWNAYPVLHLDLSAESYNDPKRMFSIISRHLRRWEKLYGSDPETDTLAGRFENVIINASNNGSTPVVVLIDEYDKPLLENLHRDELRENMSNELRGFYSVIKSCDEFIRFAMITGVTKFTHVSIFSELNNLKDISLLPDYNAICGISESEFDSYLGDAVKAFSAARGISEDEVRDAFRYNYDGYHFSAEGEGIYNPYSVINAFSDNEISDFWFQTGTPSFLAEAVRDYDAPAEDFGQSVRTAAQLMAVSDEHPDLIALLYQSGYLTIKGYDPLTKEYHLDFPNQEVRRAFWQSLYRYFVAPFSGDTALSASNFINDLETCDIDGFMQRLKSIVAASYHGQERRLEVHYQNIVSIVFHMLGYDPRVEVPSVFGFSDLVVKTRNFIYIFEFKVGSTPAKALQQIREKGYANPYLADSRQKVLIGANFANDPAELLAWSVE